MKSPIVWANYFDHIYCLHYLPARHKLPRLMEELDRVGILDSGIFSLRETVPSPYDQIIFEKQKDPACCPNPIFVNICLEVRRILYNAKHFGYKRILMLEDDVAFLKNLDLLKNGLDKTPAGFGVVQYDKFVNTQFVGDYNERLRNQSINDNYFSGEGGLVAYTSAACFGLFGVAIDEFLGLMDTRICATDIAYQFVKSGYAIAKKNLAVQVMYKGSQSISTVGVEYMHSVYKNAGVDYTEYAVPEGYGYGAILDRNGKVVKPPSDLTDAPKI